MIANHWNHPMSREIQACLDSLEQIQNEHHCKISKWIGCTQTKCIACRCADFRIDGNNLIRLLEALPAPTTDPESTVQNISIAVDGKTDSPVAGLGAEFHS